MSLSEFVDNHQQEIILEFEEFARTLMPSGAAMTSSELRDHAEELLTALVKDMEESQTPLEQVNKSRGAGTLRSMAASGQLHADDRIQHGFSLRAVLAEFRAMRSVILRLYERTGEFDFVDILRFNEAIDEALTESLDRYARRTDLFKDQFIGILSHDLRDPLGAITTGAALLAIPEDNPERRGRVASRILSSAQRMRRMIADILDLTQAKLGGAIPLSPGTADLGQICHEVLLEYQTAHEGLTFNCDLQGDLSGQWDADRLAQVIANLLGNAAQHGDGGPITISAEAADTTVALHIHNSGVPIPPDELPFVFESLVRGGNKRPTDSHSLGLGLFIARALVSAHGGDLSVQSSKSTGTTFTLRLPRVRQLPAPTL